MSAIKDDTVLGLRLMLRDLPDTQKQDMIDLFTEVVNKPNNNPFGRSIRNPAYYVPRMARVIELLALYREASNRIPRVGPKV